MAASGDDWLLCLSIVLCYFCLAFLGTSWSHFVIRSIYVHVYVVQMKGYTMLLLACNSGSEAMVRYLIEEGKVDVTSTTEDGKTGLHLAAIHDYPEIANILIQNGISVTAQDKERKTKDSENPIGVWNLVDLVEYLSCYPFTSVFFN